MPINAAKLLDVLASPSPDLNIKFVTAEVSMTFLSGVYISLD